MITTLIVDDEPLTRSYLRQALEAQGVLVVGEAADDDQALSLAEKLGPDLVLLDLDVGAAGLGGLQIGSALQQLRPAPFVVFLSGSAHHAVAAFEVGVLDYLLKPVAPDRLARMVARARSRLTDRRARLEMERIARDRATSAPRRRVPVLTSTAVRLLRIEEIEYVESRDKLVFVRTQDAEYRTHCTLGQLDDLLPPSQFFRIHLSYLVRLECIEELLFLGNHRYGVRLTGNQQVPVGRGRYPALRRRLGLERAVSFEDGVPEEKLAAALSGQDD